MRCIFHRSYWSLHVSSTRLRLLIDESITQPLAGYIVRLVPSAVMSTTKIGAGAKDPSVAIFANRDRRTIISLDSDFKKYSVDFGVIKLNSPDRATDDCLFAIFRAFWVSGHRSRAKRRRTSLTNQGFKIRNGTTFEHNGPPSPAQTTS